MKLSGSYTLNAGRPDVWAALHDPAVLARTLPGCQSLEVTGPDEYAVTVKAGVASITGTYVGRVRLADKVEPESYRLVAAGQGGPGTIEADARVRLSDLDGGTATLLEYDADAVVGGTIAGVGQRVLAGVSRRTAEEFFAAIETSLLGPPVEVEAEAAPAAEAAEVGRVYRAPAPRPAARRPAVELLLAVAFGAAAALAGVWLGWSLAGGG
ncbi:MAG: SRPBCC family protein [Nitriliruptorales bacterium]